MAGTGKKATTKPPRYRVGDRVRFRYNWYTARGFITEDRGGLDVDGGRLYGVRFVLGPGDEPRYLEVGEDELEPDTEPSNGKN